MGPEGMPAEQLAQATKTPPAAAAANVSMAATAEVAAPRRWLGPRRPRRLAYQLR